MKVHRLLTLMMFLFISPLSYADSVHIVQVDFQKSSADWSANVTLKHADTGWKHYADAWRVVDAKGNELGKRTLYHPHVDEQPFTRSLSGIKIPTGVTKVYVEAHDTVHGWSKDRVLVDLKKAKGKRFTVR